MKNYLVIIDGPKGSGKSTLWELLKEHLSNTEFFSLDNMRQLVEKTDSKDNDNEKVFWLLTEKLKDVFRQKKNAVIDSGLSERRVIVLEEISKEYAIQLHKFAFIAPYDVLHSRVKERDKNKGKIFDKHRFDYTLNVQQSKSFENFFIIDSSKLSPQEIFEMVYSKIT